MGHILYQGPTNDESETPFASNQPNATKRRKSQNSECGLGLKYCHQMMKYLGGQLITIEDKYFGKGYTVELPVDLIQPGDVVHRISSQIKT